MRIDNEVQLSRPWRIHSVVGDFTLEDVWTLPAICGREDDFGSVIEMAARSDPANADSAPTRVLWRARTGSASGSIWVGYRRPRAGTTYCPFLERANSPSPTDYRKICAARRTTSISSIYRLSRCTAPGTSSPQRFPTRQSTVSCTLRGSTAKAAPTRRRWPSTSNRVAGSVGRTWPPSSLFGTGLCIPRSSVNSNVRGAIATRRSDCFERGSDMTPLKARRIEPPAPQLDTGADYADAFEILSARTIRALPNKHSVTG